MHRRIRHRIAPNELVLFIDIDMILVAIVTYTMLDGPPVLRIFLTGLGGMALPVGGCMGPVLMAAFSSLVFRRFGAGMSEASMSWPPRAFKPYELSRVSNCTNKASIIPVWVKVSRKSRMVFASGMR